MTPITPKHIERTWTVLSAIGGLLGALWLGYGWVNAQNEADVKQAVEIAPAVQQLSEQTRALKSSVRLLREDKLFQQKAMEAQCERPRSDLPRTYCEQVLAEKRMREARESADRAPDVTP